MYLQENRGFYSLKNNFERVEGFKHTILNSRVMIDYHYIMFDFDAYLPSCSAAN